MNVLKRDYLGEIRCAQGQCRDATRNETGVIKRIFNLITACVAILLLTPLLLLLTILVRNQFGNPVLFRQTRPGMHGQPFRIYKFQTMSDTRDADGNLLPDLNRLTPFGRWLRSTSLDELPELWNVIKGEMSLVGPRPLLMEYLPLYTPEQARRHEVQPGITGWAQVNGRNNLTWEEKFDLDVWYVDHQSFWLDLRIIGLTLLKVLRREGITQEGQATAVAFKGSRNQ